MKINFDRVPKDLDGTDFTEKDAPVALKTICINALMAPFPDETPSGEEKLARYLLAEKLHKGGTVELKPEELTKIRALVGKAFPPLVVGATYKLLDVAS